MTSYLGREVTKELNQSAVSLITDGRALNIKEDFVPIADIELFQRTMMTVRFKKYFQS
jgi:hypothetical protein